MELKNRPLNSESFSDFFKNIPIPTFAWQIVREELVLIGFNDATEKLSFEGVSLGIKASDLFKDDGRILTNLLSCKNEKSNFSEECEYRMKKTGEQKKFSMSFIFLPPDLIILHIEDLTMQTKVSKALQKAHDALTGLELIINQSPAVVFLVRDEEGWPVEYITENISQFGYEPSDFYSHMLKFADIIHPDDLGNVITDAYLKGQSSATEFVQEYRIVSKLGDYRWINVRTWIKRNRENNITHFQGIILDITERKQTEVELKESDEKFRTITEQSLLGIAILQKGKIDYINKALAEIAEFEPKEIKNWSLNEFIKNIYPEDLPMIMENMKVKLEENKEAVTRYIFRILTKSKKIKWLEIISKTISYQGDLAILATILDVTEKREAEIKLRESEENLKKLNEELEQKVLDRTKDLKKSEEKYRDMIDNLDVGFYKGEINGKLLLHNLTLNKILGIDLSISLIGLDSAGFFVNLEAQRKYYEELIEKGFVKNFIVSIKNLIGETIVVELNSHLIKSNNGKVDQVEGTVLDITEKYKLEQKLKESEEKFRNIADQSLMGIYILQDDVIQYANQRMADINGYSLEEILNWQPEEFHKIISTESLDFVSEQAKKKQLGLPGVIPQYQLQIIKKSGEKIWVENFSKTINFNGRPADLVTFFDITESKKAEQKLKESEAKLSTAIESLPFPFFMIDESGRYIMQNTNAKKTWGNLIGKTPKDITNDEKTLSLWLNNNARVFSGETIANEAKYDINGESRYFFDIIAPVYVGTKIQNILGVNIDITEQKHAEQRLKESEEVLRATLESTADGILAVDDKGQVTHTNSKFADMWHISQELIEERDDQKLLDYVLEQLKDPEVFISNVEQLYRSSKEDFDTLYFKDGRIFERFSNPLIREGEINGRVWSFRDVTERKKAEQKLIESELIYKEAYNRAEFYKDIFTHDINNILSNIKSSIELSAIYLKDPNRMTDVEELYGVIRGQFTKGASLVSNIRKLSQIDESVSLVKSVEINDILKKEIDFILNSYQTRDVKIRTHILEEGVLVNANDLLIDLFNNLLNNSIKYNESRVVEIDVKMSKEKKNNTNYIKLEFIDNGIGIPDKRKETLFEKEFSKDIASKGLGIGLTLVKKIVERFRGEIWVEDRIKGDYSQGSNFIVLIPEA